MLRRVRRWLHPGYRTAHWHELPSRERVLAGALAAVVLGALPTIASTATLQAELREAASVHERVLRCLNGETTLGGEYIWADGRLWIDTCQVVPVRYHGT